MFRKIGGNSGLLENNDKRIKKYDMVSCENTLNDIEDNITYKNIKLSENHYLYSFRDEDISESQSKLYIKTETKK